MHNEQSLIWHIVPSPDHKVREVCAKLRVSHFKGLAARRSLTSLAQPGGVDYRNSIFAEAIRLLGLVHRHSFGIPATRRELWDNVQDEPELRIQPNGVQSPVKANDRNSPDLRGSSQWK